MAEPRGPLLSPGFWLHHAALAWRQQVESGLRPLGLTYTQFNLLASANWLTQHGGPPTQQQAADLAGADRMMASKVLASLEAAKLIIRSVDPTDSRARRILVQPSGSEAVRRAVRIVAEVDTAFFEQHSDAEQLRADLRRLAQRNPAEASDSRPPVGSVPNEGTRSPRPSAR